MLIRVCLWKSFSQGRSQPTPNPSGGGEVRSQESGVRINGNYRGDSRKNRSLIFLSNS
ncbi:MAG: hypothetical protein F6K18_28300 [Okeania sp. SIO2C2]|uniref:hypothetical protein n=1 Tax=Okeania sp. SIO2C2 TaxID=2607787 RepID=UPI0013BACAA4|nr:hypothetical protein [Okeania sp. SIO2C2]NEP90412.1 hypothetical protein [Okeania sp. SIO2C2]